MKNNNDTFKEYIAPVVVLVCICLVITAALALTYGVANPIIVKNAKANADAARQQLITDADSFKEYNGKLHVQEAGKVYATEAYKATNGTGVVVTVNTSSFGGALTMMVGIDKSGKITGVKVTDHSDTPGVGTKNWDSENMDSRYDGISKLNSTNVKDGQIKYVSGASVTGAAIHKGVYCALAQYKDMGGAK
ncbi:MAG: FMN-binding protein [Eubacteriales bacterium]|nr:FMN-binding protein [Eubacteriales bacterium]